MAKFDFKKLTDTVKQSADSFVKSAQENLPETMKNVNVAESMREMAQKSSEALAKFKKESENTDISAVFSVGLGNCILGTFPKESYNLLIVHTVTPSVVRFKDLKALKGPFTYIDAKPRKKFRGFIKKLINFFKIGYRLIYESRNCL